MEEKAHYTNYCSQIKLLSSCEWKDYSKLFTILLYDLTDHQHRSKKRLKASKIKKVPKQTTIVEYKRDKAIMKNNIRNKKLK